MVPNSTAAEIERNVKKLMGLSLLLCMCAPNAAAVKLLPFKTFNLYICVYFQGACANKKNARKMKKKPPVHDVGSKISQKLYVAMEKNQEVSSHSGPCNLI